MKNTPNKKIVHYFVTCIVDFAEKNDISIKEAFFYLKKYNGIRFLMENYDIEHTLSKDDTLDALTRVTRQNGGSTV